MNGPITHRCDRRLQRLQNFFCKRVYYYVNVYLNENHMSETKQNYDGKPSYSALRSITGSLGHGAVVSNRTTQLSFHVAIRLK